MIRNALWLFVISLVLFFLFLPSYTRMQDLRQKNIDYQDQIRLLKAKGVRLKVEKRLLAEDPIYLEKVAREKMGLVREGEVVYKITPVAPGQMHQANQLNQWNPELKP